MMIPDTRHRLEAAVSDLQSFLVRGRRSVAPDAKCTLVDGGDRLSQGMSKQTCPFCAQNDNGADVAGREELTAAKEELATVAAMLRA